MTKSVIVSAPLLTRVFWGATPRPPIAGKPARG
jgi:hypothetical protein